MDEQDWQPVRIAPPPKNKGHLHFETILMMAKRNGTVIRVRPEIPPKLTYADPGDRGFEVHPEDQRVFDGFDKYGRQTHVCLCQILAD